MSKEVLVIDCQVFQTAAWHRGMGKYSLNLLSALFKNPHKNQFSYIKLIFNKNLNLEKQPQATLEKICKGAEFVWLDLAVVEKKKIKDFQAVNKQIIQTYLENTFSDGETINFLLLCLFLGETTCIVFPENVRKLLLFYDLIPFLYADRYKQRIPYDDYLANFTTIYEADKIFTISQTVADDLAIYLGIAGDKLCNINGAAINRSEVKARKPYIDIGERFILMPTGDEIRKNNERAVRGFELFNQKQRKKYKLVLTSFFSPLTETELKSYCEDLVFTGNIPEEELQWLYGNADLLLFATEYEGLGLPVLEAMTVNKKIACSDIPVFKEISKDAFYYFDHLRSSEIASGIKRALIDRNADKKIKNYKTLLNRYTWSNTAGLFFDGLERLLRRKVAAKQAKPRLALFTPHPSGFSAIGKVVAESHAAMNELFDIDYYFDAGLYHREVRPDYLSSIARCYDATEFTARRYTDYDMVIYHIGNSDYHLETIKNALYLPGFIVLHDTFLDGAYERLEIDGYMPASRINLEKALNKLNTTDCSRYLTSLVNAQTGVICHSAYAVSSVEQLISPTSQVEISKLNLPTATPQIRNQKGSHEDLRICFAGIFADVKGLSIIEQLAGMLGDEGQISIFGFDFAQPDSIKRLQELPNVEVIANPSDFEFQTLLSKQDILVNYRLAYRGETSLTTLEAMRFGVVPIVRSIGWYNELPANSVVRLTSKEAVLDKILDLHHNRDQLKKISQAAVNVVAKDFSHTLYAQKLWELVIRPQDSANLAIANALQAGTPLPKLLKILP